MTRVGSQRHSKKKKISNVVSGEVLSPSAINELQEQEGTQNCQKMYFVHKICASLKSVHTHEFVPPT